LLVYSYEVGKLQAETLRADIRSALADDSSLLSLQ
jgi:hypothetical protein